MVIEVLVVVSIWSLDVLFRVDSLENDTTLRKMVDKTIVAILVDSEDVSICWDVCGCSEEWLTEVDS